MSSTLMYSTLLSRILTCAPLLLLGRPCVVAAAAVAGGGSGSGLLVLARAGPQREADRARAGDGAGRSGTGTVLEEMRRETRTVSDPYTGLFWKMSKLLRTFYFLLISI